MVGGILVVGGIDARLMTISNDQVIYDEIVRQLYSQSRASTLQTRSLAHTHYAIAIHSLSHAQRQC
jgi:hypothetical protein